MGERQSLSQIFVQAHDATNRTCDLRGLQAVRETRAVVIAFVIDKHLGLVFKTAECGAMDDAIAVALKCGSRRAFRLKIEPAAAFRRIASIRCAHSRRLYRRAQAHNWPQRLNCTK